MGESLEARARQHDVASPERLALMAACLDVATPDHLPPLWHWMLFADAAPGGALGGDGHRAQGGIVRLDPDLPRRMCAGGRVRFVAPVAAGEALTRETQVAAIRDREGRSGRLRFVTLRHCVFAGADLRIEEEQELVYRPAASAAAGPPQPAPAAPVGAHRASLLPDPVLLFRFSALTFNAHRIHYDLPYATGVEKYPGLVVHGPLQAILMAAQVERASGGRIAHFAYRGVSPAFAGRVLDLEAWPDGAGGQLWQAQTRDPDGAICITAQAELALAHTKAQL